MSSFNREARGDLGMGMIEDSVPGKPGPSALLAISVVLFFLLFALRPLMVDGDGLAHATRVIYSGFLEGMLPEQCAGRGPVPLRLSPARMDRPAGVFDRRDRGDLAPVRGRGLPAPGDVHLPGGFADRRVSLLSPSGRSSRSASFLDPRRSRSMPRPCSWPSRSSPTAYGRTSLGPSGRPAPACSSCSRSASTSRTSCSGPSSGLAPVAGGAGEGALRGRMGRRRLRARHGGDRRDYARREGGLSGPPTWRPSARGVTSNLQ